jgi:O-antigen/teichoic acid export membrane protein
MLLLPVRIKILTTILDKADYGLLTLVSTTITFVSLVFSLGSLEFLLRRLPGRDGAYQWSVMRTVSTWFGGLGVLLGAAGVALFSVWHPEKLRTFGAWDLVTCAVLLALTVHLNQVIHFLLGRSSYWQSRLLQVLYADAWFLPVLAVFFLGRAVGIAEVLWVWVAWCVFSLLCAQRWVPLTAVAGAPPARGGLREVLLFGLPLVPMVASDWLFRAGPLYLISDVVAVADYGMCFNIAWVGTIFIGAVLDILLTEFFKVRNSLQSATLAELSADHELRRIFSMMLRYGLTIVIPFAAVIGLASEHVIRFLSSTKFLNAAPLLPLLIPVPLLFLPVMVFGRTLIAMHRNTVVGWVTFGAAVANTALCLVLLPAVGINGAAIANAATYAAMAVIFGVLTRAWRWIEWPALMPVRLVLLTAFSIAVLLLLKLAATGTLVTLGTGGLLCCGCAFALGLIRRSDFAGFKPTPQNEMAE